MQKIAKALRKDAEKLWKKLGHLARHPEYRSAVCDSAGTCYSTAYWIKKKLEPHHRVELVRSTDRKYAHHAWVRVDGVDVDITGDQFGFPAVQVGSLPYKGIVHPWSKRPAPHIRSMSMQPNTYLPGTHDPQVVALHTKWEALTNQIERAYEYGDLQTAEALEEQAARLQEEMEGREVAHRESGADEYKEEHTVGVETELARMVLERPSYFSDQDFAEAVRHSLIDFGASYERVKELSDSEVIALAHDALEDRQQKIKRHLDVQKATVRGYRKPAHEEAKKWLATVKRRKRLRPNKANILNAIYALLNAPALLHRLGLPQVDHELVERIIGTGEYAVVFAVSKDKVLKVTTDLDDAAAAEAVRRHGRSRGLVEVFEVLHQQEPGEPDVFFIVAERVKDIDQIPDHVRTAAFLAKIFMNNYAPYEINEQVIDEWARKRVLTPPPVRLVRKFAEDLTSATSTAWKLGFSIDNDLHQANIGYRGDGDDLEAVVLDYGYQSWIRGEMPKIRMAQNPKPERSVEQALRELEQAPGLLRRLRTSVEELRGNVLGEGSYAIVFSLWYDRVLKVTWDPDDAAIAEAVKGQKLRGVVRIDEVYESPLHGFFIVAERLKALGTGSFTSQEDAVLEHTLHVAMDAFWDWSDDQWREYAESGGYPLADIPLAQKFKEDLGAGLKNIREIGGKVRDIHDQNVGLRMGKDRWELAILDFGHRSWPHAKPELEVARNPSWTKVKDAFDHWFVKLEKQFPDFGKLDLHSDKKAHDGGRHFGYCKYEGAEISIAFAPETEDLPENNIKGLMAHEFGHALDFRYGKSLEQQLGRLPSDVEERADAIANAVFGVKIKYDKDLIQCIACKGISRPKGLR